MYLRGIKSIPWFVIQSADCANVETLGSGNGYSSVETSLRTILYVGTVAESGVIAQIVDDVSYRFRALVSSIRAFVFDR